MSTRLRLFAIACVFVLSGCVVAGPGDAVVPVRVTGAGSGTGFVVHRTGDKHLAVTAYHVIEHGAEGQINVDGREAEVVMSVPHDDVAVLSFRSERHYTALQFARPRRGQQARLFAYPGFADHLCEFWGNIITLEGIHFYYNGGASPGTSGGPLLDDRGRVVGMNVSTLRYAWGLYDTISRCVSSAVTEVYVDIVVQTNQ